MKQIARGVICISILGFLSIGFLLFVGHAGYAIKFSSYFFVVLILGLVADFVANE